MAGGNGGKIEGKANMWLGLFGARVGISSDAVRSRTVNLLWPYGWVCLASASRGMGCSPQRH